MAIKVDERDKDKVPGKLHVICPYRGVKLRPAFQPPFSLNHKGQNAITGVAVIRDELWVSSAYGPCLVLPRDPESKKGVKTGQQPEAKPPVFVLLLAPGHQVPQSSGGPAASAAVEVASSGTKSSSEASAPASASR